MRGQQSIDLVIELIQKYEKTDTVTGQNNTHRGGCTLLVNMEERSFRYAVRKRVGSPARVTAEQNFLHMTAENSWPYYEPGMREPFAAVHRGG